MKQFKHQLHFTSHRIEVFVLQVCMVLAVLSVLIYALYLIIFGRNINGPVTVPISDAKNIVDSDELVAQGVSEELFMEKAPKEVPQEKLNTLFPSVK